MLDASYYEDVKKMNTDSDLGNNGYEIFAGNSDNYIIQRFVTSGAATLGIISMLSGNPVPIMNGCFNSSLIHSEQYSLNNSMVYTYNTGKRIRVCVGDECIYDTISERYNRNQVNDMLTNNIYRLEQIESLKDNWNGYGAKSFSHSFIEKCLSIVKELEIQPILTPTGRDSIQIEYELDSGKYLEFEIYEDFIHKFFMDESGNELEEDIAYSENTVAIIKREISSFYGS